jgi:hypothetical protein
MPNFVLSTYTLIVYMLIAFSLRYTIGYVCGHDGNCGDI